MTLTNLRLLTKNEVNGSKLQLQFCEDVKKEGENITAKTIINIALTDISLSDKFTTGKIYEILIKES